MIPALYPLKNSKGGGVTPYNEKIKKGGHLSSKGRQGLNWLEGVKRVKLFNRGRGKPCPFKLLKGLKGIKGLKGEGVS